MADVAVTQPLPDLQQLEQHKFHPVFTPSLRKCRSVEEGNRIRARIREVGLEQDMIVANQLMAMYAKLHCLKQARSVFDELHERDVFAWTTIISAYAQNGHRKESLSLFHAMACEGIQANIVTMVAAVGACSRLKEVKSTHSVITAAAMIEDVVIATNLVHTYAKCGSLREARLVFDNMNFRNVVTWNAMITAYARAGRCTDAMDLFKAMQAEVTPNNITFISLLTASGSLAKLDETRAVHRGVVTARLDGDPLVASALISAYARCDSLQDAAAVFADGSMRARSDPVCWTSMVGAYAQLGRSRETVELFRRMDLEGLRPDTITVIHALAACGEMGWLKLGKQLHARAESEGMLPNDILETALASMYSKCGSAREGKLALERIEHRDEVCWNGIIAAYAHHGEREDDDDDESEGEGQGRAGGVMDLMRKMVMEGLDVSAITYLNVLHACSHKGHLQEAIEAFAIMRGDICINPSVEHYSCLADLLGRLGMLDQAQELLETMPFEPGALPWKALLASCRTHGDAVRAAAAALAALRLDPTIHEPYVQLYNVCIGEDDTK